MEHICGNTQLNVRLRFEYLVPEVSATDRPDAELIKQRTVGSALPRQTVTSKSIFTTGRTLSCFISSPKPPKNRQTYRWPSTTVCSSEPLPVWKLLLCLLVSAWLSRMFLGEDVRADDAPQEPVGAAAAGRPVADGLSCPDSWMLWKMHCPITTLQPWHASSPDYLFKSVTGEQRATMWLPKGEGRKPITKY